jgi:hypothetical protein
VTLAGYGRVLSGRVLHNMDVAGDRDIWLAIQKVAVELEYGGY